ncbi:MAG: beta-lactamase family protein [Verrucomicrobia bacterium]|nr:beta-lactamase family protein [Verrucomicrobiota bacterium]
MRTIAASFPAAHAFAQTTQPRDLAALLQPLRDKHHLPALAAAVSLRGRVVAAGAVGVRKHGDPTPVTVGDKFHIGSITKSMTATLAAMFVERGKIKWQSTVAEQFPEFVRRMKPAWKEVTLEQLLAHRGGAPGDVEPKLWAACWKFAGPPIQHRMLLVRGTLTQEPEAPPGTKHIYSNTGYAIAGAMLERIGGKPWETLLTEMLFQPLGMKSAGFGAPATSEKVDQPWGHTFAGKTPDPDPPGPGADNPAAIGPAATVHCSVADLARYGALHAAGENGDTELAKAASFKKLHTPLAGQDYALGWDVVRRGWAGGVALSHTGSNTMFFANLWVAPKRDFAVIAATNIAGEKVFGATDEVVGKLIGEFLTRA